MASEQQPVPGSAESSLSRRAACLNCRKSKMKCHREESSSTCVRCQRNGSVCVIPDYHVGRHKGVKKSGKKAVFQIEDAIRKSQSGHGTGPPTVEGVNLQQLLKVTSYGNPDEHNKTHGQISAPLQEAMASDLVPAVYHTSPYLSSGQFSTDKGRHSLGEIHDPAVSRRTVNNDLAGAENPLQLLAQTSEMVLAPTQTEPGSRAKSTSLVSLEGEHPSISASAQDSGNFFGRFTPELDVGLDLDPVELGLVTLPESETLFDFFFQNLAHTRWGVDPEIHTTSFVRSRSAFLFTSICAASALFMPSATAVSKRLSIHCQKLANNVVLQKSRSVEIVLAFMLNIPWMSPGSHWADDETCSYLSTALTIAMDLSLHKVIRPHPALSQPQDRESIANSDCINARKALDLDGFDEVDSFSPYGIRLLRRRERTWLALFVLERGVCLARGRNYTLPTTPLVETCDKWHISEIANDWDGSIISVAVLRREFAGLIAKVRTLCDAHQPSRTTGSNTTQLVKEEIDRFFNQWYSTWPFQIGDRREFRLPPYVEILASHTRLSLYSSVINHPTAPIEVKQYFRAAGLASALNVMRAAVQGENRLKSMPNNTAIMISFAACFALELSAIADTNRVGLAPSVRNLIAETADVLERIGATPAHRKGASALYAKQLRKIMAQSSSSTDNNPLDGQVRPETFDPASFDQQMPPHYPRTQEGANGSAFTSFEPVTFSGMSNDEIVDAIDNAGVGLDMSWADFQFGDGPNLDWLDWPV